MVLSSILVTLCVRCKRTRAERERFFVARCASPGRPGRAEMSQVPGPSWVESSHNTSRLKPSEIWPLEWSNRTVHAGGETPAFRPRLARASLPKRSRQSARCGCAARAFCPRGRAGSFVEEPRRRARTPSAHGSHGGDRRARARAATRARRAREAATSRRVSALRVVGGADAERPMPALRKGARCR